MDLVSIIIPVYNGRDFIERALGSVIAQTYPNTEIIVVDDGSNDGSAALSREKLIRKCKGPWQVIQLPANHGVPAARNAGLSTAKGAWIQDLDCDDFIAPDKIELQMKVCANAHRDVVAVYSAWRQVWITGEEIVPAGPVYTPCMEDKAPIMHLCLACRPHRSALLIRRSKLEEIGGTSEGVVFWHDVEIFSRLAKVGRFVHAPSDKPLYFWRLYRDQPMLGGLEARRQLTVVALDWIEQALKATDGQPIDLSQMSAQDREWLLNDCTSWARLLYPQYRKEFHEYMAMARKLLPQFVPNGPWYLSALSRCIGYENSEAVAQMARKPLTLLRQASPAGLRMAGE